jgi:hypothetical protein
MDVNALQLSAAHKDMTIEPDIVGWETIFTLHMFPIQATQQAVNYSASRRKDSSWTCPDLKRLCLDESGFTYHTQIL